MMLTSRCQREQGLTLVEILITMTLGILLTAGILQVFSGSKQTYRVQQSLARLQENARFALDLIARDVRRTDFVGCTQDGFNNSNLARGINSASGNYDAEKHGFNVALSGVDNDADISNNFVDNTDRFTVRGAMGQGELLQADMAAPNSPLVLPSTHNLNSGNVALITNCNQGDIFQISAAAGGQLSHGISGSGNNPWNLTDQLSTSYATGSLIFELVTRSYAIRNGTSGRPALHYSENGGSSWQELVEGVEDMQVLYGEDTDQDGTANYYVPAGMVGLNMDQVMSLRIRLLLATEKDNIASDSLSYNFNGANLTATDKRIRKSITSTIALRNRLP
ncbi:MAG: PilW family protein [Methylococcaceae bacterium]